ncbi:MAG TPA: hypothetical protein VKR31_13370 [Rhizomicrobium sp.]|nr:hypothetical protein [Rhizomicrobium sp.]
MSTPLTFLAPAIDLIARNASVLPAVGGAFEDLVRPDIEEADDRFFGSQSDSENGYETFAETPTPPWNELYRPTPPLYRETDHVFRYFIDGSIKTYFLGTIIENDRSYPLELTQIGSAIVHRRENGSLEVAKSERQILLLVPHRNGRGVSDALFQQLNALPKPPQFKIVDVDVPDPLSERRQDARDKSGAKARFMMHQLEKSLIEQFAPNRREGEWIVLDGGVRKGSFIELKHTIGVAKSFDRMPEFRIRRGNKGTIKKDISSLLSELKFAHRTAAFGAHGGQVAFWYVRIRDQGEVDYPLMGVVKVEIPTPDRSPVEAAVADRISSALVGERNVTPHGLDKRWHCHIYPIFCAERAIKANFFSEAVLLASIRWPKNKAV